MRVICWTELFWPYIGGIEVMTARLLPALKKCGHELCVVTSHGSLDLPDEDEYEGTPVHRFPFQTVLARRNVGEFAATVERLAALKRSFRPDLVHVKFSDPSVFFHLHTRRAHRAPLLLSLHLALPDDIGRNFETLFARAFRAADWITAPSQDILRQLHGLLPEVTPRSSVLYNGEEMPPAAPRALPDPPVLLCAGRVVHEKGFDVAIDAFGRIADRFPQARLVIAGDGPAREALRQQAASLGLAERVSFPGWVAPERLHHVMNDATLVVVPSRWREAFGQVALQAGQMARPVVATRTGGLPEIVCHGSTGLLVENENAAEMAAAIASILDDPLRAAAMGRAARERAGRKFGWERCVDAYDELYRKLVEVNGNVELADSLRAE